MKQIEKELILVENDPLIANSRSITNQIFNKLKEIINFPEVIQELTIRLSMDKPPVIDITHILLENKTIEKINTILTIKDK